MNDPQRSLFSFDDIKFTLYESSSRPGDAVHREEHSVR
jgi:hypothetical protein